MPNQFGRTYELNIETIDGQVRTIKQLRINFDITKSILSFPNLAKIIIHNANSATLAALQKRFTRVRLLAGYTGNIRLLFKGEIRNVFQEKNNTDTQTVIYAGDGEKDWQNATFNKTFSESISVQTVVNDILKTFKGLDIGTISGLPDIPDKLLGQTLSGSSKDILDTYATEYGFDWNIQDGEVIVNPSSAPLKNTEAVLITAQTGMINSPTITEIGADVTTLLNPLLLPNKAFKIESLSGEVAIGNLFFREIKKTVAEGFYKIQEVQFKGDSREGDWTSSVKGKTLNV